MLVVSRSPIFRGGHCRIRFQERDPAQGEPVASSGHLAVEAVVVTKKDPACLQVGLSIATPTASGFWTEVDSEVTSPVGRSKPVPKQPLFMA
ncbi:hypothetical protein FHW96_001148 [Novosphingobium sp. SG751A]|nr:hypothetical protein [Novosphingobium sp. SG751A]